MHAPRYLFTIHTIRHLTYFLEICEFHQVWKRLRIHDSRLMGRSERVESCWVDNDVKCCAVDREVLRRRATTQKLCTDKNVSRFIFFRVVFFYIVYRLSVN